MAEIRIEKKKPLWPWILLLIILAIAAILYFMDNDDLDDAMSDDDQIEDIGNTENRQNDKESNATYLDKAHDTAGNGHTYSRMESDRIMMEYKSSIYDSLKLGTDVNHTKIAMAKLIEAVEIKANQFNIEINEELRVLKKDVNSIITSNSFKSEAQLTTSILDHIQNKHFPNLDNDIIELEMTINSIDTDAELKDQNSKLNSFFYKAAELLNNMN